MSGTRSSLSVALLCLVSFILFVSVATSADLTSVLVGRVVDQNGAAVTGAVLLVTATPSGIKREAVTDQNGEFRIELPRGEYSLVVTASGFEPARRPVELTSPLVKTDPIVLSVLAASATVTVSDEAVYVAGDTRTATKTFTPLEDIPQSISVIKREQITDQMLSSVADVVRYVPGASSHQGENNRDEIILRGNRSSGDFYRDGVRDDVQYYRDLYNLDRLEALKGPNAMIFGRGGGGGVINRVTKQAGFQPIRELTATGGSFYNRRLTGDFDQPLGTKAAFRINSVLENSKSFRKFVGLRRFGVAPTFTLAPDSRTSIRLGYEYFRDRRTADRGVTSFQGKPADVPVSTYYGDPDNAFVRANVNLFTASIERLFGDVIVRNHFHAARYDRGYQNYVPGAVNAAGTLVTLTAYNNATKRTNFFDQSDVTYSFRSGRVRHTIVGGSEFGRQATDNLRKTGYFNNASISTLVSFADPVTRAPVIFRQSATDADNHLTLGLAAVFVQDQLELSRYLQAIVGARFDRFDLTYRNNRDGQVLNRVDRSLSPRLGLVVKPIARLSVYGSYSVSYLPSSGDQFSSLTTVTQQVKPERFTNYEGGVKWDILPRLSFTSALYRLDRTNTRSTDPNDPTRIVQTGSQRTSGFETSLAGAFTSRWSITAGYSYQNARITSSTTAAPAGRQVAQVPHGLFSLWNKYQISKRLGAGLGLSYRSDMFAAIDNTVVLPAYLRADGAVYYSLGERWRLQANIENITNKRYFANADNNTNISPGAPRGVKIGLVARF